MCGIVACLDCPKGKVLFSHPHRGPDQEYRGRYGNAEVIFNRLTITGGDFGSAPVTSSDGRWTCFLNGEIYNFKELTTLFALKQNPSDTAVLVDGLQKIGLRIFDFVSGMYAVLLFDNFERRIFVARDPLGEKPLFYTFIENETLISSEFRNLQSNLGKSIQVNTFALKDYFRFGYIEGPKTFDKRIFEFPRGEVVEVKSGKISKVKLISSNVDSALLSVELQELVNHVRAEVMSTEVEYAVMLSGGFDSSSLISETKTKSGYAFTLASRRKVNRGEVRRASRRARASRLEHIIVNLEESDVIEGLKSVAKSLDQPHADMASLGYYKLFQSMHEREVKVAVSGIGFDELFWGYSWFNNHLLGMNDLHTGRIYWDTPQTLKRLLDLVSQETTHDIELTIEDSYLKSPLKFQRARAEMVHSYLSVNGLSQLDRLSMQFSVEARSPYSDFRLYEWAQHNANSVDDLSKKSLKKAMSSSPFSSTRWWKKRGFDIGMMEFLNSPAIYEMSIRDLGCLDERSILPFKVLQQQNLNTRERYRLLMLEYWLRHFD